LFAFSGVDGETCHAEPFVAAGTKGGIGWDFWLEPRVVVHANVGVVRLVSGAFPEDFCFSDCWSCTIGINEMMGHVRGALVDRASMVVHIAFDELPEGVFPELTIRNQEPFEKLVDVVCGRGWWFAIHRTPPAFDRRFGIAVSYASEAEAIERARRATEADLDTVMAARLAFYATHKAPSTLAGANCQTYYKAVSVMKVNVESAQLDIPCRWSTPDRMPHRHMWLWDSAFAALGLQYLRHDLAEDTLRALAAKQHDDGRFPLAAPPEAPSRRGAADRALTSGESQPPIVAWAVTQIAMHAPNDAFIEEMYPSLVRYLEWFERNRRKDSGLYGWAVRVDNDAIRGARGGESGMDNSPRFDNIDALTAVDLSSYMANEYGCLAAMARRLGREEEAREWQERRERIEEGVNGLLWDDGDQFYYDLAEDGSFIPVKTVAGFMPLFGRIASRDHAEALRIHLTHTGEFWTPLPIPSVSIDEPAFSKDMWRGPTWVNVNLLVYYGLTAYGFVHEARDLARNTMGEIVRHYLSTGCLFEYYDPMSRVAPPELPRKGAPGKEGGTGFGVVEDLGWTAAVYIGLAHETA